MNLKTPNTFVQCACGRDVAIHYIDEVRTCTCGKKVEFSERLKKYLVAKYIEHKQDSEIHIEGLEIKPVKFIKID